jgi:hypothetical protein
MAQVVSLFYPWMSRSLIEVAPAFVTDIYSRYWKVEVLEILIDAR